MSINTHAAGAFLSVHATATTESVVPLLPLVVWVHVKYVD